MSEDDNKINPDNSEQESNTKPQLDEELQKLAETYGKDAELLRRIFYYKINVVNCGEEHVANMNARQNKSKFWQLNFNDSVQAGCSETVRVQVNMKFWSMKRYENLMSKNASFTDSDCEVNVQSSELVVANNDLNEFATGALFEREEELAEQNTLCNNLEKSSEVRSGVIENEIPLEMNNQDTDEKFEPEDFVFDVSSIPDQFSANNSFITQFSDENREICIVKSEHSSEELVSEITKAAEIADENKEVNPVKSEYVSEEPFSEIITAEEIEYENNKACIVKSESLSEEIISEITEAAEIVDDNNDVKFEPEDFIFDITTRLDNVAPTEQVKLKTSGTSLETTAGKRKRPESDSEDDTNTKKMCIFWTFNPKSPPSEYILPDRNMSCELNASIKPEKNEKMDSDSSNSNTEQNNIDSPILNEIIDIEANNLGSHDESANINTKDNNVSKLDNENSNQNTSAEDEHLQTGNSGNLLNIADTDKPIDNENGEHEILFDFVNINDNSDIISENSNSVTDPLESDQSEIMPSESEISEDVYFDDSSTGYEADDEARISRRSNNRREHRRQPVRVPQRTSVREHLDRMSVADRYFYDRMMQLTEGYANQHNEENGESTREFQSVNASLNEILSMQLNLDNNEADETSSIQEHREIAESYYTSQTNDSTKIEENEKTVINSNQLNQNEVINGTYNDRTGESSIVESINNADDETDKTFLTDSDITDDIDITIVQAMTESDEASTIIESSNNVENATDDTCLNDVAYIEDLDTTIVQAMIEPSNIVEDETDESCLNDVYNIDHLDSTIVEENTDYNKVSIVESTSDVDDATDETYLNDVANIDNLVSKIMEENNENDETSYTHITEVSTVVQKTEDVVQLNNIEDQIDESNNIVKLKSTDTQERPTDNSIVPASSDSSSEQKYFFRDPSTYKEFVPKLSTPSEIDTCSIRSDESPTNSSSHDLNLPKTQDGEENRHVLHMAERLTGRNILQVRQANHSFLATIDAYLLVLEGTLAGTYRISQNNTGPSIPLVVANTMQSIRLSLETLRVHFGYTAQEHFEPLSSILRDLLTPAVDLVTNICPGLNAPNSLDFYPPLLVPISQPLIPVVPRQKTKPEYLVTPAKIHGTTVFHRHPVPTPNVPPRIPLYMNMSQDPYLGIFATPDGMLRLNLPFTFQIDITLDGAILMRNLRDKTFATISACGSQSAVHTSLCRAHHHGKIIELRITDEFSKKNMYAKIGIRGIKFGGTNTPANLHLKDSGNCLIADYIFRDLENDYIKEVFIDHTNAYGPSFYEDCSAALQECKSKTLVDGSLHFYWRDIKITQYRNGEITISRNDRDFIIWCSPEIIHRYTGTEKKGVIKVVTPVSRIISTVLSTPIKQNEKFVLANLHRNWVYYNTREFIVSNEVYSAGYSEPRRESTGYQAH